MKIFLNQVSFKKQNNYVKKVSVLIPIYNQEKYLAKALDSLLNQTLKDFEVICVNDGSKDNSLKILKEYASKDSRIKVIDQKNQGIGRTRNTALKNANGEYIAFLDPDDTFEKNALECLYTQAKEQDCDFLAFNYKKVDTQGNVIDHVSIKENLKYIYNIDSDKLFTWKDIKQKVFGGLYTASWNKIYKHDFIKDNKIHFTKSNLGEDQVFVYGSTLMAKKIGYSDNYYYNYLIHPKSALRTVSDKNLCIFQAMDAIKNLIKNLNLTEDLKKEYEKYIIRGVLRHERLIKSKDKYEQLYKRRLSGEQLKILNREKQTIPKLYQILDSIKLKKIKI